ncbi:MAG: NADH-quinone oxidoreductase subunit J [Bacillota bacterium]
MVDLSPVVFWTISAIVIGSAIAVISSKNIVHSALFLVLTFVSVAGIYATLTVDYLAAVQILVYAGAIAIMLVFGVMLTKRGDIRESNLFNQYKYIGLLIAAGFLIMTVYMLSLTEFPVVAGPIGSSVELVAISMFGDYVIPFEGAAILLLVAMVGAVMIARGGNKKQ